MSIAINAGSAAAQAAASGMKEVARSDAATDAAKKPAAPQASSGPATVVSISQQARQLAGGDADHDGDGR